MTRPFIFHKNCNKLKTAQNLFLISRTLSITTTISTNLHIDLVPSFCCFLSLPLTSSWLIAIYSELTWMFQLCGCARPILMHEFCLAFRVYLFEMTAHVQAETIMSPVLRLTVSDAILFSGAA